MVQDEMLESFLTSRLGPFKGPGVETDDAIKVNVLILSG